MLVLYKEKTIFQTKIWKILLDLVEYLLYALITSEDLIINH